MSDISNALLFSIAVVSLAHLIVSVLECRILNKLTIKKVRSRRVVPDEAKV